MHLAARKFAPDATYARAAQAGDATGLGVLYERHRARMHAVAVGMLGHGPDAEDAVQDAMVIAMRRIGELREPAAAGGWLVAVLVNVCRARLRRPARELASDVVEARGGLDTVRETVERGALSEWVWSALERLPEDQRVAVMLRHFSTSANSYAAIAELCDVPIGTVRSRLNAARRRLAGELLATAAAVHTGRDTVSAWSLAATAAMLAFQRTGDQALLDPAFAPDVAFRMADRVERRGRAQLAAGLAGDFEDGVTARLLRLIPGEHVSITELLLDNPTEQPLHCPPAVTQVHFHDAGRTHRLVSHYAPRS